VRRIVTQGRRTNPATFIAGRDEVTVHEGVISIHDGSTPGGNPLSVGGELAPTDVFAEALDDIFGLEDLIAYWKFDETADSVDGQITDDVEVLDYGPNLLHFTIPSGKTVAFGGVSAVDDNRTGMIIHDEIELPFIEAMWPTGFKDVICYGFALHFPQRWDYVELSIRDSDGSNTILRLSLYNGGSGRAYMVNSDGGELFEIETPDDAIFSGKMLIAFERDFDNYRLRINDKTYPIDITLSANGDLPSPSFGEDYRFFLQGGEDSPIVSHFFISPYDLSNSRWGQLLNAAGIQSRFEEERQAPIGIAIDSAWESAIYSLPGGPHIWRFDNRYGIQVEDVANANHLQLVDESGIDWEVDPVINDGRYAARLNGSLKSKFGNEAVWNTASFTIGAVVFNSDGGEFTFDLRGTDDEENTHIRASFTVTETSITGALKNEDGADYKTVVFDSTRIVGVGRYLVVLSYNADEDYLALYVNGYNSTVDTSSGGNGTLRLSLENPLDTTMPTHFLEGNYTIIHMAFYLDESPNPSDLTRLFASTGFQQGLLQPRGLTGNYEISAGITVDLVDGVIVSWNVT